MIEVSIAVLKLQFLNKKEDPAGLHTSITITIYHTSTHLGAEWVVWIIHHLNAECPHITNLLGGPKTGMPGLDNSRQLQSKSIQASGNMPFIFII